MNRVKQPLEAAFELVERGFSIIPINPRTKKPMVTWADYQNETASEDDIIEWQKMCSRYGIPPEEARIAIVTGKLSGMVIVDCDTPEAVEYCKQHNVWSPVRVKTKNGLHLYFAHPQDREYRPRVGSNSRGIDWPKVNGLDFRGDGSYALCPPSKNYVPDVDNGFSIDDPSDWPEWQGWPGLEEEVERPLDPNDPMSSLDMTDVRVLGVSMWEETEDYVQERFPKTLRIPSDQGNGRNERVFKFAAEQIKHGHYGQALEAKVCDFMDTFYVERLPEPEWKASCRSVEQMERTNHPERFEPTGELKKPEAPKEQPKKAEPQVKLLTLDQIEAELQGHKKRYIIPPLLPAASIVQVVGYTGHGKTFFQQLLMYGMNTGANEIGPWQINEHPNVLYLDYEQGASTIYRRARDYAKILGQQPPNGPVKMFARSLNPKMDMNLSDKEGRRNLYRLIEATDPKVIVIDTVRTAFLTLEENDAKGWKPINEMLKRFRDEFGITTVMMQHRNKPSKDGLGSYAGSAHQLAEIENQIYVTSIVRSPERAKAIGAKCDEESDNPVYPRLQNTLPNPNEWQVTMASEVTMGKMRDPEPGCDDVYHFGIAAHMYNGQERLCWLPSKRQRIRAAYPSRPDVVALSRENYVRKEIVEEWVADIEEAMLRQRLSS